MIKGVFGVGTPLPVLQIFDTSDEKYETVVLVKYLDNLNS